MRSEISFENQRSKSETDLALSPECWARTVEVPPPEISDGSKDQGGFQTVMSIKWQVGGIRD